MSAQNKHLQFAYTGSFPDTIKLKKHLNVPLLPLGLTASVRLDCQSGALLPKLTAKVRA